MNTLSTTSILDLLCNYLSRSMRESKLQLDSSQSDGRLNSQANERQISRSHKEAETYILGVLRKTFVLRAKALESFDTHIRISTP